jgi:hypothetical protein
MAWPISGRTNAPPGVCWATPLWNSWAFSSVLNSSMRSWRRPASLAASAAISSENTIASAIRISTTLAPVLRRRGTLVGTMNGRGGAATVRPLRALPLRFPLIATGHLLISRTMRMAPS